MTSAVSNTYRTAQHPMETYLREIDEVPLLSEAEERELAYRVEDGDREARDYLARANLRLVVSIARKYASKGLALPDLIAEGNFGLLRAVEAFDPSMNTRFSTYAAYWIKQSIKRALVNSGPTVRLPAYMVDLLTKWRRASAQLKEKLGRSPTHEEVAQVLNLPRKKLNIIQKAISVYNGAPQAGHAESTVSLDELTADSRAAAPEARIAGIDDLSKALDLLGKMDARAAAVLRMRYGLSDEEPKTLQQIGDQLGLTRERVRQIEVEALTTLRQQLEDA